MSPFLQMLDRPLNNACHSSLLCAPVESVLEKHAPLENFEIQCFHLEHIKFATDNNTTQHDVHSIVVGS